MVSKFKLFLLSIGYILAGIGVGLCVGLIRNGASLLYPLISGIAGGVILVLAITATVIYIQKLNRRPTNNITYKQTDIILQKCKTYSVGGKKDLLHEGKYTVLAVNDSNKKFNIRLNDTVQEYRHNDTLVLANGDTISPRSSNVILR